MVSNKKSVAPLIISELYIQDNMIKLHRTFSPTKVCTDPTPLFLFWHGPSSKKKPLNNIPRLSLLERLANPPKLPKTTRACYIYSRIVVSTCVCVLLPLPIPKKPVGGPSSSLPSLSSPPTVPLYGPESQSPRSPQEEEGTSVRAPYSLSLSLPTHRRAARRFPPPRVCGGGSSSSTARNPSVCIPVFRRTTPEQSRRRRGYEVASSAVLNFSLLS